MHLPLRFFDGSEVANIAIIGTLEVSALWVRMVDEDVVYVLVIISNPIPQSLLILHRVILTILVDHLAAQLLLKLVVGVAVVLEALLRRTTALLLVLVWNVVVYLLALAVLGELAIVLRLLLLLILINYL